MWSGFSAGLLAGKYLCVLGNLHDIQLVNAGRDMAELTRQLRIPARKNVTEAGQEPVACSFSRRIPIGLVPCESISSIVHGM